MAAAGERRPRPVGRLPRPRSAPARRSTSSGTPASRLRPTAMQFDVELPTATTRHRRRSTSAATSPRRRTGNCSPPGARVRLQTTGRRHPLPHRLRLRPPLVAGADAPADDRWFEPSGFPAESGHDPLHRPGRLVRRAAARRLAAALVHRQPRRAAARRDRDLRAALGGPAAAPQPRRASRRPRTGPRYGAWLACWTFEDFELVPGLPESKFVDLVKEIHGDGNGYQIRLLASKLVQFRGDESDEERLLMVVVLMLAIGGIGAGSVLLEKTGMGASRRDLGRAPPGRDPARDAREHAVRRRDHRRARRQQGRARGVCDRQRETGSRSRRAIRRDSPTTRPRPRSPPT